MLNRNWKLRNQSKLGKEAMTVQIKGSESANYEMTAAEIENVSGGVLALALVPFVVGFVAGRIAAEALK